MKQLKILFPVLVFVFLTRLLSSCCSDDGITSINTFGLYLYDTDSIEKVEFIGANKTIFPDKSGQINLTLNPADTISSYRVYYGDTSGVFTIAYNRNVEYKDNACSKGLYVDYNEAHISYTTFTSVSLNEDWFNAKTYVQITP